MPPAPRHAADSRLNALLDAAVDAMVLISDIGLITRFNTAAERVFGYDEADVLGRNVSMLMPEPYHGEHDGYIRRYRRTGEQRIIGLGREVIARRQDGSTFPIDLSVGEFRSGDEIGYVGILRDVSDRVRSAQETEDLRSRLAHVGRIGTLGEMVSGIAHEVNQPLSAIAAYASGAKRLLASGGIGEDELASTLEKISVQAERAGQVIRGLRNLVRRKDSVRELLDCNQLVREVVRLTEIEIRQNGFNLIPRLAEHLPAARGDGTQIQQVLLNLIRNGFDAMKEKQPSSDFIEVATRVDDEWIEISVSDTGSGIDDKTAERLFEPFFTKKPGGIGLGLSICKSIMGAHSGTLTFSNNQWGGARFVMRLPVADEE